MSLFSAIRDAFTTTAPKSKAKGTITRARAELVNTGAPLILGGGSGIYPGSSSTGINNDFSGDWRSINAWLVQDLGRIRARSRWLERASPWMQSFKSQALSNVLGSEGIYAALKIYNAPTEPNANTRDDYAERLYWAARAKFEKKRNFTTGKSLDALDTDKHLLSRLLFDGEFFVEEVDDFANDCGFSWRLMDPDMCDHTLNRILENGNTISMGVELDAVDKFPVAYYFTTKRASDSTWGNFSNNQYRRVEAHKVIHVFVKTMDAEQTRGIPAPFAASLSLYREGKFEDAALINAVLGARRNIVYEKEYPEGQDMSPETVEEYAENDPGSLPDSDAIGEGDSIEIPWGLKAKVLESQYPSSDFGPFVKTMLRASSASLGMTYMSMTGDVSDANFSSLRAGKDDERENWKTMQSFFIRNWKQPERETWLYQALRRQQIPLPLSRFDKYNVCTFVGRRWSSVKPYEDAQTNQIRLDNREVSIYTIIRETTQRDPEEVLREIAESEKLMKELGISRILKTGAPADDQKDKPPVDDDEEDK